MLCTQEPAQCTQQVCSAGPLLLCSVLPLALPCCVVLSCCFWPTVSLPQSATPHSSGLSGGEGWKINAKTQNNSQGMSPQLRHKAHSGLRRFCILPVHQLISKVKVQVNMCFLQPPPWPETTRKSGVGQRPSDGTKPGHFYGSQRKDISPGHSSPLRGRDWVNPLWLSEVTPLTYQQAETSPLREKALMTWGSGLSDSGSGIGFWSLLCTLRALRHIS